MKRTIFLILTTLLCLPAVTIADSRINLTPVPMRMTVGEGTLTLPESFAIEAGEGVQRSEALKFAGLFAEVTGYNVEVKEEAPDALIKLSPYAGNEELGKEGYTLDVTAGGIAIAANSANGFYYAFQSLKKMLPANVMAETADEKVTEYTLPIVSITDKPRFEYRGFMLDVSRHYFSIEQIERMIDVMSYYKLNRFHWHLTDDQGWRLEIKKYPRLTTVGATRNDSWSVDPVYGGYYTGEPYGPYFYTQEECRHIVEYAAARHIEVIPEVEFPGHSCAVNTAYPEFSCNPNGDHSVQTTGGIFNDVLNVANPEAVQFVKDVIDEVIEIFPYEQIHIGGDETPTTAWQNNAECKALMEEKGMTNVRQLQSHFVREISDYAASKNRSVIMWNESLTAGGTDEELIKGTGGTMMCWESGQVQPCALKAAQYGMNSVITPWGPYYINRKQSADPGEPTGAGYGDDTVEKTYNYVPVPASVPAELQKHYIGVQGTFWTEHVQSNYLLEYLALPRLIAIAETGWSPAEKKNFADFQERITKDTLLLDYNDYEYGRHYILDNKGEESKVMPVASTADDMTWYRIVTTATDARAGRCIQLLREGMNIADKTGTAPANRLWNSEIIEDESNAGYDCQLWAFMQDPANPERWAIVSKSKPNGSVKGTPTAENNTGRWDYDDSSRHYDFILGDKAYAANGDNYNYSIRSRKVSDGNMCLNYAGPGQNYSINLWNDPASGNGGIWEFRPLKEQASDIVIDYPVAGKRYRIVNNTERFKEWRLYDNGDGVVTAARQEYGADLWELVEAATGEAGQTFKLRNVATGRYIGNASAPIKTGDSGVTLTNAYNAKSGDFSIKAGDNALCPVPERAATAPNTLKTGGIYPQGTGWVYEEACLVTYECYDNDNNLMQRVYSSVPAGEEFNAELPQITNYKTTGHTIEDNGEDKIVKATYERVSFSVTMKCYTMDGNLIAEQVTPCAIGDSHTVEYPKVEFFTCVGSDIEEKSVITPAEDTVIDVYYDCEGTMGAAAVGEAVTELEDGASYLIYNAKDEASRSGFLSVSGVGAGITTTNGVSDANPGFVWTLTGDGERFSVMNNYGIYIPQLSKGTLVTGGDTPETFSFTLNSDGKTWSVKGSNGYYWNGNADNTFTGWTDGHPFIIYSYKPHPYFIVSYRCIDGNGDELRTASRYVKGGDSYPAITPIIAGYSFVASDAKTEELSRVAKNIDITYTYTAETTGVVEVKKENAEHKAIYDLSGRIVENPIKGIYIVNGKKSIIK